MDLLARQWFVVLIIQTNSCLCPTIQKIYPYIISMQQQQLQQTNAAPWFTGVYKMFIYTATVLFIIYMFSASGTTAVGALIASFFIFGLGLLMILMLTINHLQIIHSSIFNLIKTAGPVLILVGFIGYLLWLVFNYKPIIESGHVSPTYNTFMNISVLLILAQIWLLIQNQGASGYIAMNNITSSILYLLNVLLFICVNIIHSTLRYFTTDGFNTYGRHMKNIIMHSG